MHPCTAVTPVLAVAAIEPVLPFWQALGFELTVQVPHGDAIGFAILSDGELQLMYQTYDSIAGDVPAIAVEARKGPTLLFVKVTDMKAIMAFDLMATPGLVINEKLVSSGRIPTQAEIRQWLAEHTEAGLERRLGPVAVFTG